MLLEGGVQTEERGKIICIYRLYNYLWKIKKIIQKPQNILREFSKVVKQQLHII